MSWIGVRQIGQFFSPFIHLVHVTLCLQGVNRQSLSADQQIEHKWFWYCWLETTSGYWTWFSTGSYTSYMAEFPILNIVLWERSWGSLSWDSLDSLNQEPLVEAISSNTNQSSTKLTLQCKLDMCRSSEKQILLFYFLPIESPVYN